MPEGVEFPFPSLLFNEGRTYGQPEVVRISLPQVATGLRLRLPGSFRRRAFHADLLMPQRHSSPEWRICASNEPSRHACMSIWRLPRQPANLFAGPCRLLCTGHSYAEGVPADTILSYGKCYLPEINAGYGRKEETDHGDLPLYSKDCWTQQRKIHHISVCLSQW